MFTKHTPHASRRQRALLSPRHPLAVMQWSRLLLDDASSFAACGTHNALQCIANGEENPLW